MMNLLLVYIGLTTDGIIVCLNSHLLADGNRDNDERVRRGSLRIIYPYCRVVILCIAAYVTATTRWQRD